MFYAALILIILLLIVLAAFVSTAALKNHADSRWETLVRLWRARNEAAAALNEHMKPYLADDGLYIRIIKLIGAGGLAKTRKETVAVNLKIQAETEKLVSEAVKTCADECADLLARIAAANEKIGFARIFYNKSLSEYNKINTKLNIIKSACRKAYKKMTAVFMNKSKSA